MSVTSAGPAGKESLPDPSDSRPGDAAASASDGMGMCWAGDIAIEEVLAAADRLRRTRAGHDLPAWGEPARPAKAAPARLDTSCPAGDQPTRNRDRQRRPSSSQQAGHRSPLIPPPQDSPDEDPLAEDELRAGEADAGPPMSGAEIAGHMRIEPGIGLASWLGQARPDKQDEAGLVNSITGWRKLTSWAQAQELAAVAELGRRRGVMDDPERDRDPARELSAEFASTEVALALTLTQCASEWWLNLAVSLSRRLPATWSALSEGTIDLARAKLIEVWTTPLDDDKAGAVERRVLVRAGHQTTGQLRASLQRAVISVDPAAAERRRTQAEKNARVELSGEESGTAELAGHFLPAAQASAAWARINAMAEAMKGHGAGGGIDLLRAQVFIGLLLGTAPQPSGQAPPGNPDPPGTSPDGDDPRHGGGGSTPPAGGTGPAPGNSAGPAPGDSAGPAPGNAAGDRKKPEPAPEIPPSGDSCAEPPPPGPADRGDRTSRHPGSPDEQRWSWPPIPAPGEVPWPGGATGKRRIGRSELTVSWRTLAGWWDEPGQLSRIGPITAGVARELARSAAADPTCAWRVVVTDAGGQVITVTRVRRPGRRRPGRWPRTSGHPAESGTHPPESGAQPPDADARRPGPGVNEPSVVGQITVTVPVLLLRAPLPSNLSASSESPALISALRRILGAAAAVVREAGSADDGHRASDHRASDHGHDGHRASDHGTSEHDPPCTHANAAPEYRIPGRIRDLIEVRDQVCGFPICRRPASRCDLDHTVPYDQGGLTCPCNISAGCRHDHRMKGSTAWRLRQPWPGTLIWTAPSRLSWTVTPEPHVA